MGNILGKEGAEPKDLEMFYREVTQAMLLFCLKYLGNIGGNGENGGSYSNHIFEKN